MKPGTQIVYIPNRADGDINHPDVEFGFVTSESTNHCHFCRYWRKEHIGELRTTANSERTPNENLTEYNSVPQKVVNILLESL
jgi:hypothetical protein